MVICSTLVRTAISLMKGLFPMGCQEKHSEAGLQWHRQSYLQAPAFSVPEQLPDTPTAPTTEALVFNIVAGQILVFSDHQIKYMETEFQGNRKMALILS